MGQFAEAFEQYLTTDPRSVSPNLADHGQPPGADTLNVDLKSYSFGFRRSGDVSGIEEGLDELSDKLMDHPGDAANFLLGVERKNEEQRQGPARTAFRP